MLLTGAAYQLVVSVEVDDIYATSHTVTAATDILVEVSHIPSIRGPPFVVNMHEVISQRKSKELVH